MLGMSSRLPSWGVGAHLLLLLDYGGQFWLIKLVPDGNLSSERPIIALINHHGLIVEETTSQFDFGIPVAIIIHNFLNYY